MANFEILAPTVGNDLSTTVPATMIRSMKKRLRLGNKKVRLFVITDDEGDIAESIEVANGRTAFMFNISHGTAADIDKIVLTVSVDPGTPKTEYNLAESAKDWSGSLIGLLVEVPG